MSLTSYRAAPPRVKTIENGKRGITPRRLYVAIVTGLEKPARTAFVPPEGTMSPSGTIMSYIFPMQEKPALRPSVAVGEALRGVARDILAEARAAIEDPAKSDADAVHDFRRAMKRWRAQRTVGARRACRSRKARPGFVRALDRRTAPADRGDQTGGGDDAQRRHAAAPRQRPRPSGRRSRALAASYPDLRRRRRSAHPLLSRRATDDPGALAGHRRGGTARVAQARRDPSLPDRYHRAVVAALRQDVERRGATPARSTRQASRHADARKPHGAASAACALALASGDRDRRTQGRPCRGRRAHRRAHFRRKTECAAPAAGRHVDGRSLRTTVTCR